jgi:D-alanine-D-alanine ligase
VDIRVDKNGNPYVLELNSMASLGPGGSFTLAGKAGGYDFAGLVNRILDEAHKRYFGMAAPKCSKVGRYRDDLLRTIATGLQKIAG